MNVWLGEMSLSEHMGRSPLLKLDPVIMSCSHWHTHEFATFTDNNIICIVQLRLLVSRQSETFDRMVLAAQSEDRSDSQKNDTYSIMIQFYYRNSTIALDSWLWTWIQWSEKGGRSYRHKHSYNGLEKAKLSYWYARILLITKAISLSDKLQNHKDLIQHFYGEAFASGVAYMKLFMSTHVPERLIWGHNPIVVTPTYCCIFCIHVINAMKQVETKLGIDVEATFALVEHFVAALDMAGSITDHRNGAATSYGPFLASVLGKAKEKRFKELQRDRQLSLSDSASHASSTRNAYSYPRTPNNDMYQQGGGGGAGGSSMAPPPSSQAYTSYEMSNRNGMPSNDYSEYAAQNSTSNSNMPNESNYENVWLPNFFRNSETSTQISSGECFIH